MKYAAIIIAIVIGFISCEEKIETVELKHTRTALQLNELRNSVKDTARAIAKDPIQITSGSIGKRNKIPRQNYRRIWLMKNASEQELVLLLKDTNAVVRATAFEGLFKRRSQDSYKYLMNILDDTSGFIKYQSGMNKEVLMVSEYCVEFVPDKYVMDFNISRNEKAEVMRIYHFRKELKKQYFRNRNKKPDIGEYVDF